MTETKFNKAFFQSQRYLRACELIRIRPYCNPNYEKELKAVGLWRGKSKKGKK